jgi:hypothetical protein
VTTTADVAAGIAIVTMTGVTAIRLS